MALIGSMATSSQASLSSLGRRNREDGGITVGRGNHGASWEQWREKVALCGTRVIHMGEGTSAVVSRMTEVVRICFGMMSRRRMTPCHGVPFPKTIIMQEDAVRF